MWDVRKRTEIIRYLNFPRNNPHTPQDKSTGWIHKEDPKLREDRQGMTHECFRPGIAPSPTSVKLRWDGQVWENAPVAKHGVDLRCLDGRVGKGARNRSRDLGVIRSENEYIYLLSLIHDDVHGCESRLHTKTHHIPIT